MSFYGGKEGRSYHIVQKYDSIESMVTFFQQGGQYTTVNFGEYVIIDTPNKNDSDNGRLYRRGFDYLQPIDVTKKEEPGAGAIYIGQIRGPSGGAPALVASTSMPASTAAATISGEEENPFPLASTVAINTLDETHKNVELGYQNIQDPSGNIVGCYITINSPKMKVQASLNADPYIQQGEEIGVEEDQSSEEYPYWYKWNFRIPAGKHGRDLTSLATTVQPQGLVFLYPLYTDYESSVAGSTLYGSPIPFRTIRTIKSSTIAGSAAELMTILYTNTYSGNTDTAAISSTFMPTQISKIESVTPASFRITLSNNNTHDFTIPSATFNIKGTYQQMEDVPSTGWNQGDIIEVNSQMYMYMPDENPVWKLVFENSNNPQKVVQVGTAASSVLNLKGVLFVTSTFNNYWDN